MTIPCRHQVTLVSTFPILPHYKEVPISNKLYGILEKRFKQSRGRGKVFDINIDALKDAWKRAVQSSGVENITMHDLRHTYGTRQVAMGTDIYRLKYLMGHRTLTMTERYAHVNTDMVTRAAEAMDNFYTASSEKSDTILTQSAVKKTNIKRLKTLKKQHNGSA